MLRGEAVGLVIFDCDGVLVDSEVIASRVLAGELTAVGYAITAEQCRERFTGRSMQAVVDAVEADWGRALPEGFLDGVYRRDGEAFARDLQAVEGVAAMLPALPCPTCVASSGGIGKIRRSLTLTGLIDFFDGRLFSAEAVGRGKPAPDLFLHAAQRMSVAPAACVVVEDSAAGVTAGRAAGMTVLGFAGAGHAGPGYAEMLAEAGAEAVFDRMERLPGLLGYASSPAA